jgi:Ser/Thr protein kinase RdoA (MazF antagonist)
MGMNDVSTGPTDEERRLSDESMSIAAAARAFGLDGEISALSGGTRSAFRVGDVVLKQIHDTSLENHHSRQLVQWIAGIFATLDTVGFRIPRPRPTSDGAWITDDGWTAWTFLDGSHAEAADVPRCIDATRAFHAALADVPKHPLLDASATPWAFAHRHCFGERPALVHPLLASHVDRLYQLREPIDGLTNQVIHGDLNPENILIASGLAPGFIDMSPFWAPADFALAVFANWIGPRRGNAAVLRHFADVPHFDQLLVRAAIRMLLVMSEGGNLDNWDTSSEHVAVEIVIDYVERRAK